MSVDTTFTCAANSGLRVSFFALMPLILAIDSDRERAENRRRKKQAPKASPKPSRQTNAPSPFQARRPG